ncbi:DUF1801 domain-containing protein [Gordonia sp. CPCC 205515]|uniref:DUF1801 domain-containing protein n=1 Tax=Gordonia sp. CPCC 205515 TaxID=3140791 RepID=UPI003AF3780A
MKPTDGDVAAHLAAITPAARRRDAHTVVDIMREITGAEPVLWGSIIGFGTCHYRYPTGTEGDSPIISLAPRKKSLTIYLLDGVDAHEERLAALCPHTTGRGCLYLPDVDAVDRATLTALLTESHRRVTDNDVDGADITVIS